MTQNLRDALHAKAAEAKSYNIYDHAMSTAKRRTLIRYAAAFVATVILGVAALSGAPLRLLTHSAPPADSTPGPPSLPAQIGAPHGAPEAEGNPMGPASVLYGGQGWGNLLRAFVFGPDTDFGLIGASDDVYRTIDFGADVAEPGRDFLLSPDGGLAAQPAEMTFKRIPSILDLRTGRVRLLDMFSRADRAYPQAWSPDGRTLAMWVTASETHLALELVDLQTGQRRRIPTVEVELFRLPRPAFAMAFSPDGARIAYQLGEQVTILDNDLNTLAQFKLPHEVVLAGKGAWTPDGAAIVTVEGSGTQWRLLARNVADGTPTGQAGWELSEPLLGLRLLGWNPSREPVIAAFTDTHPRHWIQPTASPQPAIPAFVRVLALTPDGPRALITPEGEIFSIDVADHAIASGLTRPGALSHRDWRAFLWDLGFKIAVLIVLAVLGRRIWVRVQEYRRRVD